MPRRPNILFVFPDYVRADCVGRDRNSLRTGTGHALVETPTIDHLADTGIQFTRAYTPSPTSIPARRCLWTERTAATDPESVDSAGTVWTEPWDFEYSLPVELSGAGYQIALVGKTHPRPRGRDFGFDHTELHAGVSDWDEPGVRDDYTEWLDGQVDGAVEIAPWGGVTWTGGRGTWRNGSTRHSRRPRGRFGSWRRATTASRSP
jgi:arylsulfatase A-like enzyme